MEYGFHGYHDDPQINGYGCYVLPVPVFRLQAHKNGHHAHGQIDQIHKTVHAASFINSSFQPVMVVGILTLFIKFLDMGIICPSFM